MTDGAQSEGLPDADRTGRRRSTAVVVGGGLAGIAAALSLADAGVHVTLLEGRPRLGGLAFSFQRGDLTVDNGQHVYLRCCTAYRWFLDRVDGAALAPLQDRLDVPVLDADGGPDGGSADCGATRCPSPASGAQSGHVHPSLARRARQGGARRTGAQGPRPRRSRAGRTGLRRLAGRARSVGAGRRGTVGPRGGRRPQRGGPGRLSRARRDGVQDGAAVRPGRGRHRLGPCPAG